MTTLCCDVAETVGAVLNTSPRPPALNGLTRIGYPVRELQPRQLAPGFVFITIKKDGYGYKQHYKPRKAERYTPERLFGIAATIGYCIQPMAVELLMESEESISIIINANPEKGEQE